MNLLVETLDVLHRNLKSVEDVLWCGSELWGYFSWEVFEKLANIQYESLRVPKVATDLLVVGKDFWLDRHWDYDKGEWWEYHDIPQKPNKYIEPITLIWEGDELPLKGLKDINLELANRRFGYVKSI
jgi:hypothetical protein